MNTPSLALALVLLAAVPAPGLARSPGQAAPPPPQQQRQHAEAEAETQLESVEVLVDAVVVDKKQRPVTNLTAADVQVLEDGVEQTVTEFRAVAGAGGDAGAAQPAGGAPAAARVATHRTIVLSDGTVPEEHMYDVRKALKKYVQERLGPDEYVTLFTISAGGLRLLQTTTNDKVALAKAIDDPAGGYGSIADAEKAFVELRRAGLPQGAFDVFDQNGPGAGVDPVELGPGAEDPAERERQLLFARRALDRSSELRALRQSWAVYDALTALIDAHRGLPGRRSVTIFSEGFPQLRQVEPLKQTLVNAATSAGVALYVVDAAGLSLDSDRGRTSRAELEQRQNMARMRGTDAGSERTSSLGGGTIFDSVSREASSREDVLRDLAVSTGGLFMRNSNDLSAGLDAIERDLRNYYLIFYRPAAPRVKGEFRRIEVRVRNRPELTVRAREGYFAIPDDARELFRLKDQQLYIRAAGERAENALPFAVRPLAFGGARGGARVSYVIELAPAGVAVEPVKGNAKEFEASVYALLIARDADGKLLATERVPWNLVLDADGSKRLKAEGARYEGGIDVPGRDVARLEVIVSDEKTGKTGRTVVPVSAPSWENGPALSDVVVGKTVIASDAANGEPTLRYESNYLVPLANPVLAREDVLNVLAAVYWPAARPAQQPVLSLWRGKERLAMLPVELRPAANGANGWVFTALPMKDLTPGAYSVRITVRDAQGRSANREAAFTVK